MVAGRFHTTMVLTQHIISLASYTTSGFPYHYGSHATGWAIEPDPSQRVSIPLWFSRNLTRAPREPWESLFPYHYGSHATRPKVSKEHPTMSFHTTMVLTQLAFSWAVKKYPTVSIPLWFSRNLWLERRGGTLFCVSIPLWFSRNLGSHSVAFRRVRVSIPLWFSRNSFYYRNYTGLGEGKSNLSSSFVRKTFRVRIRVSWVSGILYFGSTLDLWGLVFYNSFDLFSVGSLLTDLESFKTRLRCT